MCEANQCECRPITQFRWHPRSPGLHGLAAKLSARSITRPQPCRCLRVASLLATRTAIAQPDAVRRQQPRQNAGDIHRRVYLLSIYVAYSTAPSSFTGILEWMRFLSQFAASSLTWTSNQHRMSPGSLSCLQNTLLWTNPPRLVYCRTKPVPRSAPHSTHADASYEETEFADARRFRPRNSPTPAIRLSGRDRSTEDETASRLAPAYTARSHSAGATSSAGNTEAIASNTPSRRTSAWNRAAATCNRTTAKNAKAR
jgi:hypothetical protein